MRHLESPLEPITAGALELPGVRHGFFTRHGGVSEGLYRSLNAGTGSADDQRAVCENLARIAGWLGLPPDRLVMLHQTHSALAHTVGGPLPDRPVGDACVTAVGGLALGIRTADCAPVLFADAEARVVGAAHAGWRGAVGGVLEAALAAMVAAGATVPRIAAAIGPTIAQASYEVGEDVRSAVARATPQGIDVEAFFRPSQNCGRAMFDLPGYVGARLAAAGVERIDDVALDTYADEDRFFSYRRRTHRGEVGQGSLLAAIVLER